MEKMYGDTVYKACITATENMMTLMQRQNGALEGEIVVVNRQRNFSQMSQVDNFESL